MKNAITVYSGGKPTYTSPTRAEELVQMGIARWAGKRKIKILDKDRYYSIRGLSCRVGETIAVATQRGKLWAQVMVRTIVGRPEQRSG